ncbi:MAG TPA: aminotransferase class III-fold pyridoxal phosphate-dependent enzyme [Gemmatimonadaceae bacterium]|jgi:glutamate-1-semialdehyde 2,1-aminomutase
MPPYPLWQRLNPLHHVAQRIALSRAKHPSLMGHPRIALRLARLVPRYEYPASEAFGVDGAPSEVVARRREGFARLSQRLREMSPRTLVETAKLRGALSDADFVSAYRVPFQFRALVEDALPVGSFADQTDGPLVRDLDGNWAYDLSGSYGVNLFGTEFYKRSIECAVSRARELGMVLGQYHPAVVENVERLRALSGLDEVSFHMSGTEAMMQAVRLARYHTRRSHVVRFTGAYHGWWDGVQAGPGNPRPSRDVHTLSEMSDRTLGVLETRHDIACVLVNPIQAMHPNAPPPSDGSLIAGGRVAKYDKARYGEWLRKLRDVCTRRGIVLIFDEVFLGFRLARGGVQEYFGVRADLVTYGKSLGGGLPVGVLCGRHDLMRRFRDDRATDICFARGTFNAHPYVMTAMNQFLRHVDDPCTQGTWENIDERWNSRTQKLNDRFTAAELPLRLTNMTSIWVTGYPDPGRYHWMYQYYLRATGIQMGWIGTGRFILSHDLDDNDMNAIADRMTSAGEAMRDDGWWWRDPALTTKAIKRRILRETISAARSRASSDR